MSRIRIEEPLIPRTSQFGLSGAADLPPGGGTPEARPPCTDPAVNPGRQVWSFSDGASQVGEGGCLAALLPRGVEELSALPAHTELACAWYL